MPRSFPKPLVLGDIDLHYMTFAEAQVLPFIGEHQPFLVKSVARIVVGAKRNKEASIVASHLAPSRVTNTVTFVDAHRDGARDEDDEQPHPSTTSAEEVDMVVASETSGADVMADVVEDPASYRFN